MICQYCDLATNDFVPINQTVEYNNIEIAVNRQGMLRARAFDSHGKLETQDIAEIHYCPLCGRKL